jgi:predicted nucleic acid-binding protein
MSLLLDTNIVSELRKDTQNASSARGAASPCYDSGPFL